MERIQSSVFRRQTSRSITSAVVETSRWPRDACFWIPSKTHRNLQEIKALLSHVRQTQTAENRNLLQRIIGLRVLQEGPNRAAIGQPCLQSVVQPPQPGLALRKINFGDSACLRPSRQEARYFGRDPVGNGQAPVGLSADLSPGVAAVEGTDSVGAFDAATAFLTPVFLAGAFLAGSFAAVLSTSIALGAAFFAAAFFAAGFSTDAFATGFTAGFFAAGLATFTAPAFGAVFLAAGLASAFLADGLATAFAAGLAALTAGFATGLATGLAATFFTAGLATAFAVTFFVAGLTTSFTATFFTTGFTADLETAFVTVFFAAGLAAAFDAAFLATGFAAAAGFFALVAMSTPIQISRKTSSESIEKKVRKKPNHSINGIWRR